MDSKKTSVKKSPFMVTRSKLLVKNITQSTHRSNNSPKSNINKNKNVDLEEKDNQCIGSTDSDIKTKQQTLEIETLKAELERTKSELQQKTKLMDSFTQVNTNVLSLDGWLSDEPLQMYFDILNNLISNVQNKVTIVNPSVCQAIKLLEDFSHILDCLNIADKEILLLPINDNKEGFKSDGGTHWSLLIFEKSQKVFYHYDSLNETNLSAAKDVATKLSLYFSMEPPENIIKLQGPIQNNGHDCGIYVILAIENILQSTFTIVKSKALHEFSTEDCIRKRATLAFVLHNRFSTPLNVIKDLLFVPSNSEKIVEPNDVEIKKNIKSDNKNKADEISHFKQSVDSMEGGSRIIVFGDSHARGCLNRLQKANDSMKVNVTTNVYPGAPLSYICDNIQKEEATFSKKDVVVIIGGTNSIDEKKDIFTARFERVINMLQHTNLVLVTIPQRFDQPQENGKIHSLNKETHKLIQQHPEVSFIPINNLLTRAHYTNHGLHMNRCGKDVLCNVIALHALIKLKSQQVTVALNSNNKRRPNINKIRIFDQEEVQLTKIVNRSPLGRNESYSTTIPTGSPPSARPPTSASSTTSAVLVTSACSPTFRGSLTVTSPFSGFDTPNTQHLVSLKQAIHSTEHSDDATILSKREERAVSTIQPSPHIIPATTDLSAFFSMPEPRQIIQPVNSVATTSPTHPDNLIYQKNSTPLKSVKTT